MSKKPSLYEDFSPTDVRNLRLWILGIMSFKLVFETVSSSVALYILDRFTSSPATSLSMIVILYGIAQSIGSTLVPTLTRRWAPHRLLAFTMWGYAIVVVIFVLAEAISGGTVNQAGSMNPWVIVAFYIPLGFFLGMIELLRRTIPPHLIGNNPDKLKKFDSSTHICYEIAGTSGAFGSTALIRYLGSVYALVLVPIFFVLGGALWWNLAPVASAVSPATTVADKATEVAINKSEKPQPELAVVIAPLAQAGASNGKTSDMNGHANGSNKTTNGEKSAVSAATATKPAKKQSRCGAYFNSIRVGAKIVFSSRKTSWVVAGYVIPLVLHRLLENVMLSVYAKNVLGDGSLSGLLLGGSNFGELVGAGLVLKFANRIRSPLPWVRADSCMLLLLWLFAFVGAGSNPTATAGWLIIMMMFVSGSWAAGDVSLLAYLQSHLKNYDAEGLDPLSAIMSFLYAMYVLIVTLVVFAMGIAFDKFKAQGDIQKGFFWISGVMMTCLAVVIFASTFIPGKMNIEGNDSDSESDSKQHSRSNSSSQVENKEEFKEKPASDAPQDKTNGASTAAAIEMKPNSSVSTITVITPTPSTATTEPASPSADADPAVVTIHS